MSDKEKRRNRRSFRVSGPGKSDKRSRKKIEESSEEKDSPLENMQQTCGPTRDADLIEAEQKMIQIMQEEARRARHNTPVSEEPPEKQEARELENFDNQKDSDIQEPEKKWFEVITKKQLIIIGTLAVFCLIIFLSNLDTKKHDALINQKQDAQPGMVHAPDVENIKAPEAVSVRRKPHKSDPARYGVVVESQMFTAKTQDDYNNQIGAVVRNSLLSQDKSLRKEIYQTIEEDPEHTQKKLQQVDAVIKECEGALEKDPNNAKIRARVERLMMLKAVADALDKSRLYAENDVVLKK